MTDFNVDFSGRHALVTGGTSGIGLAIARALATRGAKVAVTGTRAPGDYEHASEDLQLLRLDVREPGAVCAFRTQWGGAPLDLLVNSIGTATYARAEYAPAVFRSTIEVNLSSVFELISGFHDLLKASAAAGRGGNVINIASLASFRPAPGNPAYAASKAGLKMLTETLAVAWGPSGVRVNAIAPGFVATKLTEVTSSDAKRRKAVTDRTPLRRWGHADDVADCVLWLASPAASFVTGVTVPVDGGYGLAF